MELNETVSPIHGLNDDCLLHIFKFVELRDILNFELVCRRWRAVCSFLWKVTHKFDVTEEELGYVHPRIKGERDIHVEICRQIFARCFSYLTRINLSRSRAVNFEKANIMDTGHDCPLDFFAILRQEKLDQPLDDLKNSLATCERIEKLYLCVCVLSLDDEFLMQLLKKNRNLRSVVLSKYRLTGKCLSYLPLNKLESIELYKCKVDENVDDQYRISIASNEAPKLHTLSVPNFFGFSDFASVVIPISSLELIRLNLEENDITQELVTDICKLKNLTYLNLRSSCLNDQQLALIIDSCKKLTILDISYIDDDLTDVSLRRTNLLPHLKCLNIGFGEFTDAGLETINKNLQMLDLSSSKFSSNAILAILRNMQNLEKLDLSFLEDLDMNFVRSAIDIVNLRQNSIPLEIGLFDTGINIKKIRNTCPQIKFVKHSLLHGFHGYAD